MARRSASRPAAGLGGGQRRARARRAGARRSRSRPCRRTRGRRPRRCRRCRGAPRWRPRRTPRGTSRRRSCPALRFAAALVRSATVPLRQLLVLGVQRQPPEQLAGDRRRPRSTLLGPVVVVGDQPGVGRAERDDDGAGQRRDVDDPLGALARAPGERVGEDQPALGVGVVDLDRLAVELGDDVAGPRRASPLGMFSTAGTTATRSIGQAELGDRRRRLEHRGAARHVLLHQLHAGGGLDRDAAGVEGDALADEAERRAARRPRRE